MLVHSIGLSDINEEKNKKRIKPITKTEDKVPSSVARKGGNYDI